MVLWFDPSTLEDKHGQGRSPDLIILTIISDEKQTKTPGDLKFGQILRSAEERRRKETPV
jgi:hypothetical protein